MRGLASSSGAVLGDGHLGYRFVLPVAVELRVAPVQLGLGGSELVHGSVTGFVMLDTRLVAAGLGGGVTQRSAGRADPVLGGLFRAGARDGLSWTTVVQLRHEGFTDGRGWVVDDLDGTLQVPLTARGRAVWLALRGRGSAEGVLGELGVRVRVRGTSAGDALALTPVVGGARYLDGEEALVGPVFGVSFDAAF